MSAASEIRVRAILVLPTRIRLAVLIMPALLSAPYQVNAQLDETIPYEDLSEVDAPVLVRATVPGWLRTGQGVRLLTDLKLDESLGTPPSRSVTDKKMLSASSRTEALPRYSRQ